MRIQDLDKPASSGKEYYWEMKYRRARIDRKPKKNYEDTSEDDFTSVVFGISAIIALVFCILYIVTPNPSPVWMFLVAGGCWGISGVAKIISGRQLWIATFSFLNVLFAYLAYAFQYGMI